VLRRLQLQQLLLPLMQRIRLWLLLLLPLQQLLLPLLQRILLWLLLLLPLLQRFRLWLLLRWRLVYQKEKKYDVFFEESRRKGEQDKADL
jgi:hypothetical protein